MGPLPLEVGNMTQIVDADLSDNRLTGEIPSTLSKCLMLLSLDMAGNLFEGSIPPSLRTLIGLQYLNLSRNRLSGQIPIYFQNFTMLEALNLSFNSLEGEGDACSFGILLLELFTGIRPTDVMFKDGWTLHEFVKTAQHKNLLKILDHSLLSAEYPGGTGDGPISDPDTVRFEENVADIMRIGVLCSVKLPNERMDMMNALSELRAVERSF
ncbi:hypothetical protein NL676_005854 [Syzygium grande]|nr:hypothetical protein NL676_005854 [Syzygium grande]